MDKKQFKEELRARITDFAVSAYLTSISSVRKESTKEKETDEMYKKLEKWIMEQIYPMIENPIVKTQDEQVVETLENGFAPMFTDPDDNTIRLDF